MVGEPAESPGTGPSHQSGEAEKRRGAGERRRASEREGAPERQRADEREGQDERVGPLTLTRGLKDDGRALIIYARAAERR